LPHPGPAPRVFYGWRIVGVTFLAQFVAMGTVFYSYGILLKPLAAELGASRFAVGSALPAMVLVGGLLGPLVGREVDRRPIRLLLVLGAVFLALGFSVLSRATALWHFALAYAALISIGLALLGGIANTTLINNWFVRARGTALGISQIGVSLSGMVMAYVTTWLVADYGWRTATTAFALLPLVLVAPVAWLVVANRPEDLGLLPDGERGDGSPPRRPAVPSFSFRQALRNRSIWLISLVIGLNFASNGAVIQVIHSHTTDLGHSETRAASTLALMAGMAALGKPLSGRLADRIEPRGAMALSIALQVAGLALLKWAPGFAGLLVAAAVFGIGYGGVLPVWGVLVGTHFDRGIFGRVMGAMGPMILPFQMVGVPFATAVYDRTGSYDSAFTGFFGLYALALALLVLLGPTPGRRSARLP
jgi:predicted MFS family arabinose efflux permease